MCVCCFQVENQLSILELVEGLVERASDLDEFQGLLHCLAEKLSKFQKAAGYSAQDAFDTPPTDKPTLASSMARKGFNFGCTDSDFDSPRSGTGSHFT